MKKLEHLTQKELMELAYLGACQRANDFFDMYEESNDPMCFKLYCEYEDISIELLKKYGIYNK